MWRTDLQIFYFLFENLLCHFLLHKSPNSERISRDLVASQPLNICNMFVQLSNHPKPISNKLIIISKIEYYCVRKASTHAHQIILHFCKSTGAMTYAARLGFLLPNKYIYCTEIGCKIFNITLWLIGYLCGHTNVEKLT